MLPKYQGKGYGTQLLSFIKNYVKSIGCFEMFVLTDKGNPRACHVYEKLGGKNDYEDEICYVYNLDNGIHSMGIIIQDKYRGKGYSYQALVELEKIAFEKNNISELSDIISLDRIGAIKSFKKAGFIHTDLEKVEKVFGKESVAKQLLITKEIYFSNKLS